MWRNSEHLAYNWFKENYDDKAILYGDCNSTKSDIYSYRYNSYIEIKQLLPSARCGQFTQDTGNSVLCQSIINGDISEKSAKDFVKECYKTKNVTHVIVVSNDINLYTIDEFLSSFCFNWQIYDKGSGTNKTPKKDWENIKKYIEYTVIGDRIYALKENLAGQYFEIENKKYFISKNKNSYLEIRKCSKTKNKTWLVEVTK